MSDTRSDEQTRDRIITFRVEDEEADRLRTAAADRNLSLSSYLRLVVLARVRRDDLARRLDEANRRIEAALAIINDWANDRDDVKLVTLPTRITAALSDSTEGDTQ